MRIEHLKNQFRSFTLVSGKSLYLYPMATDVEISEQDFFLSKKFQRYVKDDKAVVVRDENSLGSNLIKAASEALSHARGEIDLRTRTVSLEDKPKKFRKKQKDSEE